MTAVERSQPDVPVASAPIATPQVEVAETVEQAKALAAQMQATMDAKTQQIEQEAAMREQ